jgi:hypothetical protein
MNPPNVYELTMPSNHMIKRITKIVQSISPPFYRMQLTLTDKQIRKIQAKAISYHRLP